MNLRPVASAVAVLLAAALVVFAAPRAALATRDYAKKESKECGFCHVSDKGGGPRNPKGREYEANGHQFGVKSWTNDVNEQKYLRANSAIVAQWYAEATKLLDDLAKEEKLPGGLALVDGTRDRFKMYKRAWLAGAKKLLGNGERGVPNALVFLAKVESQFGTTEEGREAGALLDSMSKDAKTKDAVELARTSEKVRLLLLEGRTEFQLGHADKAKELLEKALADPRSKPFEQDVREALAALAPPK